jgi:hypothetical protein
MRLLPLIVALLICGGCHVRAPLPGVRASGGARAHADVRVDVRAHVRVRARSSYRPPPPPPPEALPKPVPLEGSTVVEFFGVPLEGAQDVVFLLDRSGSMIEPATGRIAQLSAQAPPTPAPHDAHLPEEAPTATAPIILAPDGAAHASPYDAQHEPHGAPVADEFEPQPEDLPPPDPTMDAQADAPIEPETAAPAPQHTTPRKIDVARRELIEALAQLPAGTRLNVIFFSNWLEAYAPGLTPLDEDNRQDMMHFVDGTEPRGATALATAMRAAFMMGARHVVLLSDGLGNMGGRSEETLRDAREAMRGGLRIDTIGIGPDQDRPLLRALAHESGGLYQAF